MPLGGRLTTVGLLRLGDLAIAVDDCGAFGECDGLARLALGLLLLMSDTHVHESAGRKRKAKLCGYGDGCRVHNAFRSWMRGAR